MEETRKIQVLPKDEQEQTKIWQDFGWTLVSSQEINNTDSHLEQREDSIYSVTTTENYINLLFKRDTNMPNYQTIAEYEKQYYSIPKNTYPKSGFSSAAVYGIGLIVAFILGFAIGEAAGILIGLLIAAGSIFGAVKAYQRGTKNTDEAAKQNQLNDEMRSQLRNNSRSLL